MDKIEMRFGQRVKELRLKQNISQEELLQEKYKRIIEIYQEEVPYIGL